MKKKKTFKELPQVNPMQDQYFLGGLFGKGFETGKGSGTAGMVASLGAGLIPGQRKDGTTSVGGSAAKGTLGGIAAGASFGPIGMGVGALLGGLGGLFTGARQRKQELQDKKEAEQLERDQATQSALAQLNFNNSSNLPMAFGGSMQDTSNKQNVFRNINNNLFNRTSHYAMGGNTYEGANMLTMTGDFTHFANGGTHEENPYGGIPQGYSASGKLRTVEEGEGKFKFPEGNYIFSNRLKFE